MKVNSVSAAAVLFTGTASAIFGKPPPPPEVHVVDGFNWKNPFKSEAMSSFAPACETKVIFNALEYTLHELMRPHPKGLGPWANGLKKFFSGREYPGGWYGLDRHLHDRSLLFLDYDKVPIAVREWIEEEERTEGDGKGLFAVFEKPKEEDETISGVVEFPSADQIDRSQDASKVVIFAPGALYSILPLWNAEGSDCKDDLLDLSKYKPTLEDGGVVAWIEHTEPIERATTLQIEAKKLKAKPDASPASEAASEKTETATRDEL